MPTVASAQDEPTVVCTEIAVVEGSIGEGAAVLSGTPADGECDMTVYVPLVVADGTVLSSVIREAEKAIAEEAANTLLSKLGEGTLSRDDQGTHEVYRDRYFELPTDGPEAHSWRMTMGEVMSWIVENPC